MLLATPVNTTSYIQGVSHVVVVVVMVTTNSTQITGGHYGLRVPVGILRGSVSVLLFYNLILLCCHGNCVASSGDTPCSVYLSNV